MSRSSGGGRFCDVPSTEDALAPLNLSDDQRDAAARLVARLARDDADRDDLLAVLGL